MMDNETARACVKAALRDLVDGVKAAGRQQSMSGGGRFVSHDRDPYWWNNRVNAYLRKNGIDPSDWNIAQAERTVEMPRRFRTGGDPMPADQYYAQFPDARRAPPAPKLPAPNNRYRGRF